MPRNHIETRKLYNFLILILVIHSFEIFDSVCFVFPFVFMFRARQHWIRASSEHSLSVFLNINSPNTHTFILGFKNNDKL